MADPVVEEIREVFIVDDPKLGRYRDAVGWPPEEYRRTSAVQRRAAMTARHEAWKRDVAEMTERGRQEELAREIDPLGIFAPQE